MVSKQAIAAIPGVTPDAFDVTNSTFDFAWNGTQKGFESQAQARLAFLDALANVSIFPNAKFLLSCCSNEGVTLAFLHVLVNADASPLHDMPVLMIASSCLGTVAWLNSRKLHSTKS